MSWRERNWKPMGLVAAGVLAYLVVLRFVGERWELPEVDGGRALALLALALLAQFSSNWVFGVQFSVAVRDSGKEVSRWGAFRAALVASGVARLIPAGGALTPAAMSWTVRNEVHGTAGAAIRVTILSYGGLLVAAGVSLLWLQAQGVNLALQVSVLTIAFVAIGLGVTLLAGSRWLGSIIRRLPEKARTRLAPTAANRTVTPVELVLIATRTLLEAVVLGLAMAAFDVNLSFAQMVAAFGVATVLGGLPGLPGGIGIIEAGLVGILAGFGYSASTTVAPVLVYRIITYWIPAAAGLMAGGTAWTGARPSDEDTEDGVESSAVSEGAGSGRSRAGGEAAALDGRDGT